MSLSPASFIGCVVLWCCRGVIVLLCCSGVIVRELSYVFRSVLLYSLLYYDNHINCLSPSVLYPIVPYLIFKHPILCSSYPILALCHTHHTPLAVNEGQGVLQLRLKVSNYHQGIRLKVPPLYPEEGVAIEFLSSNFPKEMQYMFRCQGERTYKQHSVLMLSLMGTAQAV